MQESKSCALPLGERAMKQTLYHAFTLPLMTLLMYHNDLSMLSPMEQSSGRVVCTPNRLIHTFKCESVWCGERIQATPSRWGRNWTYVVSNVTDLQSAVFAYWTHSPILSHCDRKVRLLYFVHTSLDRLKWFRQLSPCLLLIHIRLVYQDLSLWQSTSSWLSAFLL